MFYLRDVYREEHKIYIFYEVRCFCKQTKSKSLIDAVMMVAFHLKK